MAWANEFVDISADEFGVNGTHIQASKTTSWAAAQFANAAEILKTYEEGSVVWTQADTTVSSIFFLELLKVIDRAHDDNSIANDIQAKIEARLAIAVFMDNRTDFNAATDLWKERLANTIYLRRDGAVPLGPELVNNQTKREHWGNPLGYGKENPDDRMPDGIQLETCRDLNHVDMGFRAMMYSAQTALNQGVDLFHDESDRLTAFMDYHSQIELGTHLHPQVCNNAESNNKVKCRPQLRAGMAPDCPIDTWYLAYHRLTNRLDLALDDADQLVAQEEYSNVWVQRPLNLKANALLFTRNLSRLIFLN